MCVAYLFIMLSRVIVLCHLYCVTCHFQIVLVCTWCGVFVVTYTLRVVFLHNGHVAIFSSNVRLLNLDSMVILCVLCHWLYSLNHLHRWQLFHGSCQWQVTFACGELYLPFINVCSHHIVWWALQLSLSPCCLYCPIHHLPHSSCPQMMRCILLSNIFNVMSFELLIALLWIHIALAHQCHVNYNFSWILCIIYIDMPHT